MVVLKLGNEVEVKLNDDDWLLLESGDMIRAWAYKTHCIYNSAGSDVRVKEILTSIRVINND